MGYYVNPRGQTKEAFLEQYGTKVETPVFSQIPSGNMLVALVDNGWMTAAAIAYCESEFQESTRSDDERPRTYYYVPISALKALRDPQVDKALKHAA